MESSAVSRAPPTGRSITVPFTSNAGNITVPAFHSRNLADDATP